MNLMTGTEQARAAGGEIEDALDAQGFPWRARLSLWIDLLVVLEERQQSVSTVCALHEPPR